MNRFKSIRERLGVTQQVLADAIGRTQGNIGHYEQGQTIPPKTARKLIAFAKSRGIELTFDDIYQEGNTEPVEAKQPSPAPVEP